MKSNGNVIDFQGDVIVNFEPTFWNDRGNYDASGDTFPSSGGSGTAGAILKGDLWIISVGGTLGSTAVALGDTVRALVDSPGSTPSNWAISENSIGYLPEDAANKSTGTGLGTSDTLYPSQNAVKTYVDDSIAAATLTEGDGIDITGGVVSLDLNGFSQVGVSSFYTEIGTFGIWAGDGGAINLTASYLNLYGSECTLQLNSFVVTDLGTSGSIRYADDYSANYTDRSLVDKGYVDSLDSNLVHLTEDETIAGIKTFSAGVKTGETAISASEIDWATKNDFYKTIGADATFTFSNIPSAGTSQTINVTVIQDGTGGWTVTWPGGILWSGGSVPVQTAAAGAIDIYTFKVVNGTVYGAVVQNFS